MYSSWKMKAVPTHEIVVKRNCAFSEQQEPMVVQLVSEPYFGSVHFKAGPAQFGYNLRVNPPVSGHHTEVNILEMDFNANSIKSLQFQYRYLSLSCGILHS